jgi:hypothetical protein
MWKDFKFKTSLSYILRLYLKKKKISKENLRVVVAHAFNPSTWEVEAGGSS